MSQHPPPPYPGNTPYGAPPGQDGQYPQPGAPPPPLGIQGAPPPRMPAGQYPPPPGMQQMEGGGGGFSTAGGFSNKSVRNNFIKKVYWILTVQLLFSTATIAAFQYIPAIREAIFRHSWIMWVALGVFFVTYLVLMCCTSVRRKFPWNLILLCVFTIAFSLVAAVATVKYKTEAVLIAGAITVAVTFTVSMFAMCTSFDFTKCGFLLGMAGMVFFFFGIACVIVYAVSGPNKILQVVYASIGVLLFTLYLAYDTQLVIGGRSAELSEEDYVGGALHLYVDIMQIFMLVLQLVGAASDD